MLGPPSSNVSDSYKIWVPPSPVWKKGPIHGFTDPIFPLRDLLPLVTDLPDHERVPSMIWLKIYIVMLCLGGLIDWLLHRR